MSFRNSYAPIALSTILASVIPSLSMAVEGNLEDNPNQMIPELMPPDEKYGHDIYGLIALQLLGRHYDKGDGLNCGQENDKKNCAGIQLNNESRLGWRGFAHFDALPRGTTFIWQIESGYVDPSFSNQQGAYLGTRDTFVGVKHETMGLLRLGRVLTPLYELVDWPGSNPGLGDIWDWGGSITGVDYNDRQSDTIRWDSNELWSGFTLDVAIGLGQDRDGETNSEKADSNYYHSMAGHQKYAYGDSNWIQLDLAYEINYKSRVTPTSRLFDQQVEIINTKMVDQYWNNYTYLAGLQGANSQLGYFAQYRYAKAENSQSSTADEKETGYTAGLTYNFGMGGKWQAKAAYAKLDDLKVDGQPDTTNTGKHVWSVQMLFNIDSNAVVYIRYRDITYSSDATSNWTEGSAGVEYWF